MAKNFSPSTDAPGTGFVGSGVARTTATTKSLRSVVWIVVLSRLFFMEAASLAYLYLPHAWVEAPPGTLPPSGSLLYHATLGLWVHWDGLWYYSIANFGYAGRATATAFFPLYPLTLRLFQGSVIGGVVISLLAFIGAVWFLVKLVNMEFGPRAAWYAGLALAFFPTAFYTNAVYSESLFLVLAIGSLYYARNRKYWIAGPLAALTTLVSMYGILLAAPFAILLWQQEGLRWKKYLHLAWPPLGLSVYMGYLLTTFGDPLIFEHAQSNWGRHFAWIWTTLWTAATSASRFWLQALNPVVLFRVGMPSLGPSNFYNFVFALVAILLVVVTFKRLPFYLWVYMVLALLVPLSYPATGNPLMSMPRLLLEAFPLFIGLGVLMTQKRWIQWTYFVVALPLGLLFVSLFATAHWVA